MSSTPAQPTWLGRVFVKSFRTLFVTLLFAILGMAIGGMAGILWYGIGGAISHTHPDMTLAYRIVAFRAAAISGACALLYQLFLETRTAPRPRR